MKDSGMSYKHITKYLKTIIFNTQERGKKGNSVQSVLKNIERQNISTKILDKEYRKCLE